MLALSPLVHAALKPLANVLAEPQLAFGVDKAELSELLDYVDNYECFRGLAVLLNMLVRWAEAVCCRVQAGWLCMQAGDV